MKEELFLEWRRWIPQCPHPSPRRTFSSMSGAEEAKKGMLLDKPQSEEGTDNWEGLPNSLIPFLYSYY